MKQININKDIIDNAIKAIKESSTVEFKSRFDPSSPGELIEIIKDIIAMSNSGGGCILIGVNDDGCPSDESISPALALDQAIIIDKIKKFTGVQFDLFEIQQIERMGKESVAIIVAPFSQIIIFEEPGTYLIENNKQKTAFGRGTVYFRHGAKSDTGNNDDIRFRTDSDIDKIRDTWLGNIVQVFEAPRGYIVRTLPPEIVYKDSPESTAIRITDSLDAPVYRIENPDLNCPYKKKDVIQKVNNSIFPLIINQYDFQSISFAHKIDTSKPNYFYQSRFGPKQYSDKFVEWLIYEIKRDSRFVINARNTYKERLSSRRSK
jgi:hypothetical protein